MSTSPYYVKERCNKCLLVKLKATVVNDNTNFKKYGAFEALSRMARWCSRHATQRNAAIAGSFKGKERPGLGRDVIIIFSKEAVIASRSLFLCRYLWKLVFAVLDIDVLRSVAADDGW